MRSSSLTWGPLGVTLNVRLMINLFLLIWGGSRKGATFDGGVTSILLLRYQCIPLYFTSSRSTGRLVAYPSIVAVLTVDMFDQEDLPHTFVMPHAKLKSKRAKGAIIRFNLCPFRFDWEHCRNS